MKVGLFDSGVGGLTVLKSLIKRYPHNEYIYYGDTLNNPYGNKTRDELICLSNKNIKFLIDKGVDIIIIACGSVSSNCFFDLNNNYDIPIYDIVSPVIQELNNANYENIGLIATSATIDSHIFKNSIHKNVYEIRAPKLVPLIEHNQLEHIKDIILDYMKNYIDKIDVLVLGCTHYPIIKNMFLDILPNNIRLLDMADSLKISDGRDILKIKIYFSKLAEAVISNIKKIMGDIKIEIFEDK